MQIICTMKPRGQVLNIRILKASPIFTKACEEMNCKILPVIRIDLWILVELFIFEYSFGVIFFMKLFIFFVKIEFVLLRKSKNIENEKNSGFSNCSYVDTEL